MILEKCVTKDAQGKEVSSVIKAEVVTGKLIVDRPFVITLDEENETRLITSPVKNIKKTSGGMVVTTSSTSYYLND